MRFITRFYEMTRPLALMRQAREVAKLIDGMNRKEQLALAQLAQQQIDLGPSTAASNDPDRPWGDVAEQALARARSTVPQLRRRGLATWLATVFHETRDSSQGSMRGVHREVLGFLGRLKGTYGSTARRASTMAS